MNEAIFALAKGCASAHVIDAARRAKFRELARAADWVKRGRVLEWKQAARKAACGDGAENCAVRENL